MYIHVTTIIMYMYVYVHVLMFRQMLTHCHFEHTKPNKCRWTYGCFVWLSNFSVVFFVTDTVKGIRTMLLLSPWLPIQESQI